MQEQSTNYGYLWVLLIAVILVVAWYIHTHGLGKDNLTRVFTRYIETLNPRPKVETIESLSKQDIVNYFKSMALYKERHIPFVARIREDGKDVFILAVYDNEKDDITNCKMLSPQTVNADVLSLLGNEKLVVLN